MDHKQLGLSRDDLAAMYRTMILIRRFEEVAIEYNKKGDVLGNMHMYVGEEAVATGVCRALKREDYVSSTHRCDGHLIAKGADPKLMMAELMGKVEGLRVALDMTKEWADMGSTLITGGLIVRTAFLNEHPEAVKTFLEEYAASTQYVNEHPAEAAALVEQYIGVAAGVAKKAIPACNIVCMTGEEMKAAAEKYLTVLFELNPDAVGGAMPEESFYYLP